MSDQSPANHGTAPSVTGQPPEGVYFHKLVVANARCFGSEPQTLQLTDPDGQPAMWNVLLGNNGTGKTTLLQLLGNCGPEHVLHPPKPNLPVLAPGVNLKYFDTLNRNPPLDPPWSSWDESRSNRALQVSMRITCGGRVLDGRVRAVGSETAFSVFFDTVPSGWLLAAYGATRRLKPRGLDEEASSAVASLFDDDAPLFSPENWLFGLDYAAAKADPGDMSAAKMRDRVKALFVDVLPEIEDIRFVTSKDDPPRVEFKCPYGWVDIHSLGLGYRTMIAWLADFVSRMFKKYQHLPDPLSGPAICLVDEIDLHLHPTWQRKIRSYLRERFPRTQFIVTAHSPLIVQASEDANLVLLRREGDHVVIDNDVDEIKNWRLDQILTSELFGLESARSPSVEKAVKERVRLLSQPSISDKDRARAAELEKAVGALPPGDTADEAKRYMDLLERANRLLEKRNGAGGEQGPPP